MRFPDLNFPRSRRARLCVALLLLCCSVAAVADVFRWRDAQGVVHYGDRQPDDAKSERVAVDHYVPPTPRPSVILIQPAAGPNNQRMPIEFVSHQPSAAPSFESATATLEPQPISVLMYLSPTCGWCVKAKNYFDRRGVPWRGVDISRSDRAKREFAKLGGRGTPLIFIEGKRFSGFDQDRIGRALDYYGW